MPLILPFQLRRKRQKQSAQTWDKNDLLNYRIHCKKVRYFEPKPGISTNTLHKTIQEKNIHSSKRIKLTVNANQDWNFSSDYLKNVTHLELTIETLIDKKKLCFLEKMSNVQTLCMHIKNNLTFASIIKILFYAFRKLNELILDINLPEEIGLEKVHEFMKVLRNNSRLSSLAIKFDTSLENFTSFGDYFLSELGKAIILLPQLNSLELSLVPFDYDNDVYDEFWNNIAHLKNLHDIHISGLDSMDVEQSILRVNTMLDSVSQMNKVLGLSIERIYFIEPHISQIFEKVSDISDIIHLDLGLKASDTVEEINFSVIGDYLSKLSNLRSLDLSFTDFALNNYLGQLGANLSTIQQLHSLTLFFFNSDVFDESQLLEFSEHLSKLTKLNILICRFGTLHFHPVSGLKPSIRKLAKLKDLTRFEFGQWWKLADRPQDDDTRYFVDDSQELLQRKKLTLHLKEYDLLTYWLIDRIQANQMNYPELEEIIIEAKGATDIGDEELMTLTKMLLKCPKLTSLKLRINGTPNFEAEESDTFLRLLNKFPLQVLEFTCADCYFSDDIMMVFCDALADMKNLKSLKLEFRGAETMTPVGVIYLYERLALMESLKEVSISQSSFRFSKLVWREITGHLKKLKLLDHLVLKFYNCFGVTNFGVECFADALEQLKNLCEFRLVLSPCYEVSDTSIARLIKSLNLLKLLNQLELEFQYAPHINQEIRSDLDNLLSGVTSIENKSLIFTNP